MVLKMRKYEFVIFNEKFLPQKIFEKIIKNGKLLIMKIKLLIFNFIIQPVQKILYVEAEEEISILKNIFRNEKILILFWQMIFLEIMFMIFVIFKKIFLIQKDVKMLDFFLQKILKIHLQFFLQNHSETAKEFEDLISIIIFTAIILFICFISILYKIFIKFFKKLQNKSPKN